MIYPYNSILFLAEKDGRQVFYLYPQIIDGFWEAYSEEYESAQSTDMLAGWTETVPPVLRQKIKVYEGDFANFKDLVGTPIETALFISLKGVESKDTFIDPKDWVSRAFEAYKIS